MLNMSESVRFLGYYEVKAIHQTGFGAARSDKKPGLSWLALPEMRTLRRTFASRATGKEQT